MLKTKQFMVAQKLGWNGPLTFYLLLACIRSFIAEISLNKHFSFISVLFPTEEMRFPLVDIHQPR
ncbi:hypothetical protein JKG68_07580 [Microvirga aerilata]|uniref:Uncharacterized protein n=1 Tax=Microvirga aerilata TaxID=670292 RepID=A0A936ZBV5_9HYPH|nr:hypothetical protein [Microvirga aerilata]MBL0403819.1 hypothetical protein [Microvirga aerilata]